MELFHAGDDYDNFFDARSYLRSRFSFPKGVVSNEEYQAFDIRCYHDFYQKYRLDPETARVLEFGGGPCIFPLISAAPHVKEIVFAEYLKGCRNEVQLWKDCSPEAHDWTPCFRHIVQVLEKGEEDSISAREDLLRSKITAIIPCDIYDESILSVPYPPFDVVSCNNTLGPVSSTLEQFEENCKKVGALVKPGGYITMLQSEEGSFYKVMDKMEENFHSLFITRDQFHKAIEKAGFTVVMSARKDSPLSPQNIPGNRKGIMFAAAIKHTN